MFSPDALANQAILITGGGTGLGRAMALNFAAHGAKVGILGRRTAPLEETVGDIRAAGGEAAWTSADVRSSEAVGGAIDAIEAELGPLTGLVNNAAGNFLSPSEDLSDNAFDAVMKIVLYGSFYATRDLGRRWIARESGGCVLNISTTYAWMGSAFVLPSAAAKAGVFAMTRSLAVEWATYGIRHNSIAPGPIPTEGAFSRLMTPGMEEEAKQHVPLKRFGRPEELADLALFLMSPAAGFITGECVTLDGGEWLLNGQEFSRFTMMDRSHVKQMLGAMKPKKG